VKRFIQHTNPGETDYAWSVMQHHLVYSPGLFRDRTAKYAGHELLHRLRDVHRIAAMTSAFGVPGAFDSHTLDHFLSALWREVSIAFRRRETDPDSRRALQRVHESISDLKDALGTSRRRDARVA
jgi:hypothetical protein